MQNKRLNIPPIALTNAVANLLNCALTSVAGGVNLTLTQPYLLVTRLSIVNKTASPHNFTLYKGLTGGSAAGTEVIGVATVVAANAAFEYASEFRLDSADFLTGLADANTVLVLRIEAEIGFS
jgi:hypothetical protein